MSIQEKIATVIESMIIDHHHFQALETFHLNQIKQLFTPNMPSYPEVPIPTAEAVQKDLSDLILTLTTKFPCSQ